MPSPMKPRRQTRPGRSPIPFLAEAGRTASAVAGLVLAVGCGSGGPAGSGADPEVVARIDEDVLTVEDVQREVDLRAGRAAPIPELPVLVDEMVERRILVEKAIAEGLDRDPELRRSWENLLIGRYKENHLRDQLRAITITDEEIGARYEGNADRYSRPAKARLAILTLRTSPVMSPEEREAVVARMAEARGKVLAADDLGPGPGFGRLAVPYSEDQVTRHRGGDTGWLDEGVDYRWPAEVVGAGFDLKVGAVSEPLVTDDAVYLVRKLDERPASRIPLAQVRDQIRKELQRAAIDEREKAFAGAVRADVTVETFPGSLDRIRIPEGPKPDALVRDQRPPSMP